MARYQWDTPHEWLEARMDAGQISAREVLNALLDKVDSDTLQDLFQDEMSASGYFEDLDMVECPHCEGQDAYCGLCNGKLRHQRKR